MEDTVKVRISWQPLSVSCGDLRVVTVSILQLSPLHDTDFACLDVAATVLSLHVSKVFYNFYTCVKNLLFKQKNSVFLEKHCFIVKTLMCYTYYDAGLRFPIVGLSALIIPISIFLYCKKHYKQMT